MGLNMPAKTVVFTAVKKFDGDSHRYIGSGEYIQVSEDLSARYIVLHLLNVRFCVLPKISLGFSEDEWKSWSSWQG